MARPLTRRSRQLGQVLGHGPTEGDERIALLRVDLGELGAHGAVDGGGLQALVVEDAREGAVASGGEGAVVVVAGVDAEALGEAAAPGPLLTRRLVVGAGNDV